MIWKLLVSCLMMITNTKCQSISRNSVDRPSVPLLLLISLDGFRWDYPEIYNLTNFHLLHRRGVRMKYVENSFATATFPSHMTIVTGLHQETHGIIANEMFDRETNETVNLKRTTDIRWWLQNSYTEPIWISNQLAKDSKQRRSAVIAWPGNNIPIDGQRPFRSQPYESSRSFDSIVEQMFVWFRESEETRINFGAIYHHEPDETGHRYGPLSSEIHRTLINCDRVIGRILNLIDEDRYLQENLNVIVTSDHGMDSVEPSNVIDLDAFVDSTLYLAYGTVTFKHLFVHSEPNIDRIYRNLSLISSCYVYRKRDIPEEFHYKNNVRVGDILIIAKRTFVFSSTDEIQLGQHGYRAEDESMRPIFYAFGPAFRENFTSRPFSSVDIYPLMSFILGLEERQTNGSLDKAQEILKNFHSFHLTRRDASTKIETVTNPTIVVSCLIVSILIAVIYIVVGCRQWNRSSTFYDQDLRVQYRILTDKEESMNNLIISESDEEEIPESVVVR